MKRHYDFTKRERGKFYKKGATLKYPIYLDAELQSSLEKIAKKKGAEIGIMVNQFVRKELELLQELS